MRAERSGGLLFRRYSGPEASMLRSTVESVYSCSYVEAIASGHSFDSVAAFMSRFDSYAAGSGFDMIVAYHGDDAIGQTWGWPLDAGTGWWEGLESEPEPGFTQEDGVRTFALSEIMVCREWAGHGVARAMHDQLLQARPESRATLLVEPENLRARRAYLHWGWHEVAQLRPGWDDAPAFDVFMRNLGSPAQARC